MHSIAEITLSLLRKKSFETSLRIRMSRKERLYGKIRNFFANQQTFKLSQITSRWIFKAEIKLEYY